MGYAFTTYSTEGLLRQLKNRATIDNSNMSLTVDALWDTGASGSCISQDVVEKMHLKPTGMTQVLTPSGKDTRYTYLVDVVLPNNVRIADLCVIESEIGAQGIGLLVGMDIISAGDFAVSNFNGRTCFTFRIPSEKRTDYVQETKLQQLIGPKHGTGNRKKRGK